ncbi:MAG: hypothetical protein C0425_08345 [Chlorobiaceae bacterium]|nr:hypothetical protein [Chlorobiaceae bacterium]MBA4310331.1 hypothetical protein [Chlorobiaceae bacterium]
MAANTESNYQKLHKPSSEFSKREEYLENELRIMEPKRWKLNLPKRDFNFEVEDLVPAIAGTIGKIVMTTAIVTAFAVGFGLSPEFIVQNVRYEILIAALLFVIPISGFFNPRANLPGCHGPMIPLIASIVAAGGHPLALGLMVAVIGLMLGFAKGGSRLVNLTGVGVRGGLLIFLGVVGLIGQIEALRVWAAGLGIELVFLIVILVTIVTYAFLGKIGKKWLAIPLCSLFALVVALLMGAPFKFETTPGIPNLNPMYWWGENTGWMLGLPDLSNFIAVIPFAFLAIAMWPPDFLGHRIFQEMNYPKDAKKVLMDVDDTTIVCSLRQAVGSALGGGNLTSSWGTYMIPAGIAKRPIAAGAILTGAFCVIAVVVGYPMDLAVFPPVLRVALIVGVFLPLLEAGMKMIKDLREAEGAAICMFGSVLINPVFGWALAMVLDNSGLIGDKERSKALPIMDRIIIPLATLIICAGIMAIVGMTPGIPPLI